MLVISDTKCVEIFDGAEIEKKKWDFIHYFNTFKMIGIFEGTNPVLYRPLLVLYLRVFKMIYKIMIHMREGRYFSNQFYITNHELLSKL